MTLISTVVLTLAVLLASFFVLDEVGVFHVMNDGFSFDDNILISIFWPPTQEYLNDEQWQYMKDAEIDWIMSSGDNLGSEDVQMKMLDLCNKYGIHMTVADNRLGINLLDMNEDEIRSVVDNYKYNKAARGYYMLDEPLNPNIFLDAHTALKKADPDAYMHLNFLPYGCYESPKTYQMQMNDWCKLTAADGYPTEYLMYDLYPYGLQHGSMNRTGFLLNLDSARIVGLRNNVKTANYIQSVSQTAAFRSPNRAETLYEINMSLAFGVKQLSYFTWFTPHDRSEPFDDGIITKDGVPNPKYEFICELNEKVHNVGKTLIDLDSKEVYESKNTYDAMPLIPDDFFLQAVGKDADFTVSYMKDKKTGRVYAMIVNNDFENPAEFDVALSDKIKQLEYISYDDGEFYPLATDGNVLHLSLEAGGAIIIRLPKDFEYSSEDEWTPRDNENLALRAEIYSNQSYGTGGFYLDGLNDGNFTSGGWRSTKSDFAEVVFDFGQTVSFNRIDIYPCVSFLENGENFPDTFGFYVSDNGKNWKQINDLKDARGDEVVLAEFGTRKARYLKIKFNYDSDYIEIREIEVYNDDGSVPVPTINDAFVISDPIDATATYKDGDNVALNKKVYVTSYPDGAQYKGWGWWPDFLVDGNKTTGWTSNVKIHMNDESAQEACVVDLAADFNVERVEIVPRGCWPKDFEILVSKDAKTWTSVACETNSYAPKDCYTLQLDEPVSARFVKFVATKMRSTDTDGYMVQLSELRVFGKPV